MRAVLEGSDVFCAFHRPALAARDHVGADARLPLSHQPSVCTFCRRPFGRDGIVQRHAIGTAGLVEADVILAPLAREGDDRNAGMARLQRVNDPLGGRKRVFWRMRRPSATRPSYRKS